MKSISKGLWKTWLYVTTIVILLFSVTFFSYIFMVFIHAPENLLRSMPILIASELSVLWLLLLPIIIFKESLFHLFPFLRTIWQYVVRSITIAPIYLITIAIMISVLPVSQNPGSFIILLIAFTTFAIGSVSGIFTRRIDYDKFIKIKLLFLILTSIFFIYFPSLSKYIKDIPKIIEAGIIPEPKLLDIKSASEIIWVDHLGNPIIYFSKDEGGNFYLYDRSGWCGKTVTEIQPADNSEIRKTISDYIERKKSENIRAQEVSLLLEKVAATEASRKEKIIKDESFRKLHIRSNDIINETGTIEYGICIINSIKDFQLEFESLLLDKLTENEDRASFTLIKNENEIYENLFEGNNEVFQKLQIIKYIDYLIIGKYLYHKSKQNNSDLKNVISIRGNLQARVINCANLKILDQMTITQVGAGMTESQAIEAANNKVIYKLMERIKEKNYASM